MIPIIGLAATILLTVWIILKQPRRQELLLLIPFIVASNFFGFLPYDVFTEKGTIQQSDLVFGITILLSVFFINKKPYINPNSRFYKTYKALSLIFILFLVVVFVISVVQYRDFFESFRVFRRFLRYSSVLFFMFMVSRLRPSQVEKLLVFIENLTIVLCALYIVDFGFGVKIFAVESYIHISFQGQELSRNFFAIPIFAIISLARFVLKRRFSLRSILGIGEILITFLLTYTRNFLASAFFVVALGTLVWFFYYGANIRRVGFLTLASLVIALAALNIFSNQLEYLMTRVLDVEQAGGIEDAPTFLLRQEIILSRVNLVLASNPITGLGFLGENFSGRFYPNVFVRRGDTPGALLIGDQSWGNVIASIGFGGTALLLLLVLYPIYYILRNKDFSKQRISLYAVIITLLSEFFITAFFGTDLIDDVFQICFYFALVAYFIALYETELSIEKRANGIRNNPVL